ncbi:hypothetical protein [Granulosicoccus antarcticus]|uniref:Uncharacterized protein n=1 Tax=Granulosicoccus antarcticus IMCC3135 TaxID=1192854 RepID=A0A2Z2NKX2_9GAMM|nr:hypothetical protein [Granulosicoccus antarcticus]ASJ70651.1 hypothetical protein IMCC3135_02690 [Granulosicoccus antarcticus IMCC3135]
MKITEGDAINELTWRVNEDGQFCQQMFSNEEELCDSHVVIKDSDGNYNTYNKTDGEPGYPFTLVSGNPEGF